VGVDPPALGLAGVPRVAVSAGSRHPDVHDDVFPLVRDWGASRPGTYALISPVIVVVIGCALFDEKLDWGEAVP